MLDYTAWIDNDRDGRFILPFLQPCVGMFLDGVELCWSGPLSRFR
jgi:hypothetical protein